MKNIAIFLIILFFGILAVLFYNENKGDLDSSFFTQSEKDKIINHLNESDIKEIDFSKTLRYSYNILFIKFNNDYEFSKSLTLQKHYSSQYLKNLELLSGCNFDFKIYIKNNTLNFKTYNFKKECFSLNDTKTVIFEQLDIIKDIALENLQERNIAEKIKQENLKSYNN